MDEFNPPPEASMNHHEWPAALSTYRCLAILLGNNPSFWVWLNLIQATRSIQLFTKTRRKQDPVFL